MSNSNYMSNSHRLEVIASWKKIYLLSLGTNFDPLPPPPPLARGDFLALLDYVSRANEIEIRLSVRRPSVCDIDYLWSYWMDFFSNFSRGFR